MKVSYIILICSAILGVIFEALYRKNFWGWDKPFWFIPVMTAMLATFLVVGYRGWTDHW